MVPTDQLQTNLASWLNRPTRAGATNEANSLGALATTTGNVRTENQDRAVIAKFNGTTMEETFIVAALADGIGGLKDGGLCASLSLAVFLSEMVKQSQRPLPVRVINSVLEANNYIFRTFQEKSGSTLSLAAMGSTNLTLVANVGDSRVYKRVRYGIVQVTTDDTIGSQLSLLGPPQSTNEQIARQLTQYIGMRSIDVNPRPIFGAQSGLVLTSDGIHGLGEKIQNEIVSTAPNDVEIVRRLTTVAKWCTGSDNATIISFKPHPLGPEAISANPQLTVWDSFGTATFFVTPFPRQSTTQIPATTYYKSDAETSGRPAKKSVQRKKNRKSQVHQKKTEPGIEVSEEPLA
jgi:serine/threonine protein phosphatase PrpC